MPICYPFIIYLLRRESKEVCSFLADYSTRKCASYLNILGIQVGPMEMPAMRVSECMLAFNGTLVNNKVNWASRTGWIWIAVDKIHNHSNR